MSETLMYAGVVLLVALAVLVYTNRETLLPKIKAFSAKLVEVCGLTNCVAFIKDFVAKWRSK